jgi:hypothetical protein
MALSLWKSRGYELAGFEVKVSRADWRVELSDASKAEVWTDVVDRWWIVAPKGIVPVDELPAPWGLLEVATVRKVEKLVVTKHAPLLTTQRHDIKRSFLVPLLRAAGAGLKVSVEKTALDEARKEGRQAAEAEIESLKRSNDEYFGRLKDAQQVVREIEQVLGCHLGDWVKADTERAKEVAAHLRAVLRGDEQVERARKRVENAAGQLEQAAKQLRDGERIW